MATRIPTLYLIEKADKLSSAINAIDRRDGRCNQWDLDHIRHLAEAIIAETHQWSVGERAEA